MEERPWTPDEQAAGSELSARLESIEQSLPGDPGGARKQLGRLLAECRARGDLPGEAQVLILLGGCDFYQGRYEGMRELVKQAHALSVRLGLRAVETRCLNSLGLVAERLGQLEQALEYYLAALELAVTEHDEPALARALMNMGFVYLSLGKFEQALSLLGEAEVLGRRLEQEMYTTAAAVGALWVRCKQGECALVAERIPELLRRAQVHRLTHSECLLLCCAATVALECGETERGLEQVERGLELARRIDNAPYRVELELLRGRLLVPGNPEEAERLFRHVISTLQGQQHDRLLLEAHDELTRLYAAAGRHALALEESLAARGLERGLREQDMRRSARLQSLQTRLEALGTATEQPRPPEQAPLLYQTSFDPLTGVLSRSHMWLRVQQALDQLGPGRFVGLLLADVDRLKAINNRYDQTTGDQLLVELARRMSRASGPGNLVSRLSGDEFLILLPDLSSPEELTTYAQRLLVLARLPAVCGGHSLLPSLSLGGVLAPLHASTVNDLQQWADHALHVAKKQGGHSYVLFDDQLSSLARERRALEHDLRRALALGQLRLYYQGQFDLPEQRLSGFEALIRWIHPERGMISPADFIPVAEESHLIVEIGQWVLEEACRQAAAWRFRERRLSVAVNVSALQFQEPRFVDSVRAALKRHELPGRCLVLELTESVVQHELEQTLEHIAVLRTLGVRVAMDDFGTGYSSLSILQRLPMDFLKIDRSFLPGPTMLVGQYATARRFMELIIGIAGTLGMTVVAEGVETAEQLALLCALGCDKTQGFYLARPVPAPEAAALLPELSA